MGRVNVVAAGGVVWRRNAGGKRRILVVHRPKYDDWSFPKGKLNRSEHVLTAAAREIAEETGCVVRIGRRAGVQEYKIRAADGEDGEVATKLVHYWTAEALDQSEFVPNDEVDQLAWLPPKQARRALSYPHDIELLDRLAKTDSWAAEATLVVLRHAPAVRRKNWPGSDSDRTLSAAGTSVADLLVEPLRALGVDRILCSDAERCRATVRPYANDAEIGIEDHPEISERGYRLDPKGLRGLHEQVWQPGHVTAVCSHRPVLGALARELGVKAVKYAAGDFSVVHRFADGSQDSERFSAP